ncbi:hypothetical protein ACHAXA_009855 [Cyclostephanos tholiformis]|uniref:Transcription factor CBF/NF-Y/archaeal histone domain-containing protein n=1 Tax=Cyclostephanos tholiformis TaxID=382380 RepID=A0ABD3R5Y0_9STRA
MDPEFHDDNNVNSYQQQRKEAALPPGGGGPPSLHHHPPQSATSSTDNNNAASFQHQQHHHQQHHHHPTSSLSLPPVSSSANCLGDDYEEIREQDRYLPIANISRIMKNQLPESAKIAKESKEAVQETVSEFISFITSEASDKCMQEKRKTINGDDLLWAMSTLGFDRYVEPLKVYLAKYREAVRGDKPEKSPSSSSSSSSSPGGGGVGRGCAEGVVPMGGSTPSIAELAGEGIGVPPPSKKAKTEEEEEEGRY